jgi:membrane protease YdiL (CAAX protease family)
MLFSQIAAALYGAWVHGNPFAHHLPHLFPVDFLLAQLWPFALLALCILACRSLPLAGGLPLGLGSRGASGLAADVISGLMLLPGVCWRAKMAVWAAGFPDANEHPLQEMAGFDVRFLWWLLPLVCLVGPAAEEFYFRGLLQGHLRARVGPVTAIALTALFFGLVHPVSAGYVAVAAAIGVVLGYLRERSGTLAVPILTHALWNTAVWSIVYFR